MRKPDTSGGARIQVAIVDYGMGNLFSVLQACERVGLRAAITSSRDEILNADATILPGVGAFGDAMETLHKLDLASALREIAVSGKPFIGICLGMQLLMTESHEFGWHQGLGIIEGENLRLTESVDGKRQVKVPQVGWNRVHAARQNYPSASEVTSLEAWQGTLLEGLPNDVFMYFVHSFYPKPKEEGLVLTTTQYGEVQFCSSLRLGNVFACQFHPERSGFNGLQIYRNLAASLSTPKTETPNA